MRLYINNQEIDLPDNVSINYVKSSSFLNPLQGTYTFPFSLRATPNNAKILNYPHIPSIAGNPREEFSAELWVGSFQLIKGVAKIVSATESIISITLEAIPANISKALWQKNLNEFDLGSETIATTTQTSQHYWTCQWSEIDIATHLFNPGLTAFYFNLFINGTDNGSKVGPSMDSVDYQSIPVGQRTIEKFKADMITQIELWSIDGVSIHADTQNISVRVDDIVTEVRIQFNANGYDSGIDDGYAIDFFQTLELISYTTINQTYYDTKINNEKYALPEIKNLDFYTDSADWCGIINKQVAGKIQLNNDEYQTRNTVIPMLKFPWLINKLLEVIGYEQTGSFLANTAIQKLLLFNLFSTDKQASETTIPFNVHNPVVTYAQHLPKMKLSDFFQALIDQFAIGIEFNSLTGMVEMFFVKDIFNGSDYLDLTDRISFAHNSELQDLKKKQLKWNASGDDMVTDTETIFHSFPTDSVIENEKDKYQPLELQFPSLVVAEENSVRQIPEIKQNGVSPLFGQNKVESPKRLLFWENAKADNITTNMRLSLYGSNNIKDLLHTEKLSYDNNYLPVKAKSLLTIEEIASFQFRRPVVAYNVIFFAEDISVKITKDAAKYEVELKLRRYVP